MNLSYIYLNYDLQKTQQIIKTRHLEKLMSGIEEFKNQKAISYYKPINMYADMI